MRADEPETVSVFRQRGSGGIADARREFFRAQRENRPEAKRQAITEAFIKRSSAGWCGRALRIFVVSTILTDGGNGG